MKKRATIIRAGPLGVVVDFGRANVRTTRRQLMAKIDARSPRDPLLCSVCAAIVEAGGRKSDPALCARCYQRDRRGLAPSAGPRIPRDQKLTVQFTKHGREQLERQAKRAGVSVSVFLEGLVEGGR